MLRFGKQNYQYLFHQYLKKNHNGYYVLRKTIGVDEKRFMDVVKKRNLINEKRKLRKNKEKTQ